MHRIEEILIKLKKWLKEPWAFSEGEKKHNILFCLNRKCLFDCIYCRMQRTNQSLPLSYAYKTIDLLAKTDAERIEIQFFGGEPLLQFPLLKDIIDYSRQRLKRRIVNYIVTTNGLHFTKKKISFLMEHGTEFICSIDGMRHTQMYNRPLRNKEVEYPHKRIIDNVMNIQNLGARVLINMVVLPQTIAAAYKDFSYLLSCGFQRIKIAYALGIYWPQQSIEVYLKLLCAFLRKLDISPQSNMMKIYAESEPILTSPQIFLDINGTIYIGCVAVVETILPQLIPLFYAGKIGESSDIKQFERTGKEQAEIVLKAVENSDNAYFRKIIVNNLYFGMQVRKYLAGIKRCIN